LSDTEGARVVVLFEGLSKINGDYGLSPDCSRLSCGLAGLQGLTPEIVRTHISLDPCQLVVAPEGLDYEAVTISGSPERVRPYLDTGDPLMDFTTTSETNQRSSRRPVLFGKPNGVGRHLP
jgi:hypothetical protein